MHKVVAELEGEKKEIGKKKLELDQIVAAAKVQVSCLRREKKTLEERLTKWQRLNPDLQEAIKDVQAGSEQTKKERDQLMRICDEMRNRGEEVIKERETLREEYEKVTKERTELRQELEEIIRERDELRRAKETMQE